MTRTVSFVINGHRRAVEIEDNELLLDVIRDRLEVRSVKAACWRGECGLCTALVNGRPVKTCMMLAADADGSEIVTAEGLPEDGRALSPLQESFVEHGAMQCGFCTPAFVVTAHYLLSRNPDATDEEIKEGLNGLICRCGTYYQILEAVKGAARGYRKVKAK